LEKKNWNLEIVIKIMDVIKITSQNEFTTKYIIEVKFTIKGVVEKSDIVGAIFGQR